MFYRHNCIAGRLPLTRAVLGLAGRRFQGNISGANRAADPPLPIEKMWILWNEGNLFSLNISQLQNFLMSQKVQFDVSNSKKAALIRLVEEVLQARDNQMKGGDEAGAKGDQYGRWQQGGQVGKQTETLLDLHQAGFYENSASMAPKAFQLLVSGHTPDLVVSRVNTTLFPGFPSNNECYTLCNAISELALRARYSKALQWCVMNMRNLSLQGEFSIDFGKMVLKPEIIKKSRKLLSAWSLQQRAQLKDPYTWISSVSEEGAKEMEKLLEAEGFTPVELKNATEKHHFDVHIRRRKDTVNLELNADTGKCIAGYEMWFPLQRSHLISQIGGQDVRLQLHTRNALRPQEIQRVSTVKILDIQSDAVNAALPPEMGQVIYTSENTVRAWVKQGEKGIQFTMREIRRTPLIVTSVEEEDERIEYIITTAVPAVDLNWFANQLFDMAKRFQDALTPTFIQAYDTEVKPLAFERE